MLIKKLKNKIRARSNGDKTTANPLKLPKEVELFIENKSLQVVELSSERLEFLSSWCFSQAPLRGEYYAFCSALIIKILDEHPKVAFRLTSLLEAVGQSSPLSDTDLLDLKKRVLANLKIGVAVITYNRLELLQKTVTQVINLTSSNIELMVSDDGSVDGTSQWCNKQRIACSEVKNSGVVANKNRALYYLHDIAHCDISILLEDDCYPVESGWEQDWALSALVWGHVNYAHKRILAQKDKLFSGYGSVSLPYRSSLVTGQCTATSYQAIKKVGYLNSIFKGYGCGHVEWSERFLEHGFNGSVDSEKVFACINSGLFSDDAPTHKSEDDILRNRQIKAKIKGINDYQFPWATESERMNFISDVETIPPQQLMLPVREKTPYEQSENYLFVHLSKTAGTSFRIALAKKYNVWEDYGAKVKDTHINLRDYIYRKNQTLSLKNEFSKVEKTWLLGHFPLNKYSDFVSVRNIVTFVRNPVEQVISHYNHFVRYHKYKGSLDEFLQRDTIQNFQSKNLKPLPVSLIGFVGITELYEQSLDMLNISNGIMVEPLKININDKQVHITAELPSSTTDKVLDLCSNDVALYKEALALFKQRALLQEQGKEWTYAHLTINKHNVLTGCAYYSNSSKPVELVLLINSVEIKVLLAQNFYGAYAKANFPRERYIGIHFNLPKDLKADDKVEVIVKSTKQNLTLTPLKPILVNSGI